MSKVLSISALEEIVQEAVTQHGDDWAEVDKHIRARLRTIPETGLEDIDKELRAIVNNANHAARSGYLQ